MRKCLYTVPVNGRERLIKQPQVRIAEEQTRQVDAALLAGEDGLIDAWLALGNEEGPGWTCHEAKGGWRIDFAFVTPDLKNRLRHMSVDQAAQGSDHQPIRIEIDF